jgi:hypothetical protein
MVDLVCRPEEVTVEWMNQALVEASCLDAGAVTGLSFKLIGTGKMGDNARFTLEYEGEPGSAPATVIGKFPAEDETARAMAAGGGAYYNEVMFYREFAPRTSMRTPTIYAAEVSEDRTEFILLMEDLAPAQPGSNLVGESLEHTRTVLAEAAKLAATFYGEAELGARDYVMAPARDDGGAFGQALMEDSWPRFVERFGKDLTPECIAFGERFASSYALFVSRNRGVRTIAHADLRSENVLFGKDSATIVDWQTVSEGNALTDAAYFLGGSVDVVDRRAWEKDLVGEYRGWLAEEGVDLSFEECWEQYREQAMHGILITVLGATFSAPAERSDRMFLAMIQRHLQHCVDLDAGAFIG